MTNSYLQDRVPKMKNKQLGVSFAPLAPILQVIRRSRKNTEISLATNPNVLERDTKTNPLLLLRVKGPADPHTSPLAPQMPLPIGELIIYNHKSGNGFKTNERADKADEADEVRLKH